MSDNKVTIIDVGWFNNGEDYDPFNFFIEVEVDGKKATIHSVKHYGSRSGATKAAHNIISAFGWNYKKD